jgi:branched-chain amino acid transport system substrate-binding protein
VLAAGALLVTSCTGGGGGGRASSPGGRSLVVGVIAPLSGDSAGVGTGVRNSVDLAIHQAVGKKLGRWRLEVRAEDDADQADIGAQAATRLAADPRVVAVVGPLSSAVARRAVPILAAGNVLTVSPGNIDHDLTLGPDNGERHRPHGNYFRVIANAGNEAPVAADDAARNLGAHNAAVIHDDSSFGRASAAAFRDRLVADGGTVAVTEAVKAGDADMGPALTAAAAAGIDAVFFAGGATPAAVIARQARERNLAVPLLVAVAGPDAALPPLPATELDGVRVVWPGAPAARLSGAPAFLAAYNAAHDGEDPSFYGPYAFDAASAVVHGLVRALAGRSTVTPAARRALIAAVQGIDAVGATGRIRFDEYGDTTDRVVTLYRAVGGTWQPERTAAIG